MDGGFEPQVSIDDDHSHQKVNSLTDMESGNFGHCHNEAKNSLEVDPFDRHDVPRHQWRIQKSYHKGS
ncbi:hypothetical protein PS1_032534 [Malus domestica]